MKELTIIQPQLKVPKARVNSFAKYPYRTVADILEAVKPLCADQGCHVTCDNDLVVIGGELQVKATATITNGDGDTVSCNGFATVDYSHPGMSKEQCMNAAESYANKKALCNLLAIDDSKDIDELPPMQHAEKATVTLTDGIKNAVASCNDIATLKQLFKSHEEEWKRCKDIVDCVNARKQQLMAKGK